MVSPTELQTYPPSTNINIDGFSRQQHYILIVVGRIWRAEASSGYKCVTAAAAAAAGRGNPGYY